MRVFFYRFKRYLRKRKKKTLACLIVSLVFAIILTAVETRIAPMVESLSETAVRSKTAELINEGFIASVDKVEFDDIYKLKYGENGEITGLFLNSFAVNKIKSEVLKNVNSSIKNGENTVKIPIGNIFGGGFLSGRGKAVTVKILSVTALTGEIVNKTKDSGVNQTHLSSYININAEVCASVFGKSIKTSTESNVLLCESVIVGKVPDTFMKVNVLDDETLKWLNSYK